MTLHPISFPRGPNRRTVDIGRLLAALPSGQREALTLRFVDGMSMREIAEALEHTRRHGEIPASPGHCQAPGFPRNEGFLRLNEPFARLVRYMGQETIHMTTEIEQDEQLPSTLVDELKRIDRAPAVITARVDRTLSTMAKGHFSSRQVQRWRQPAWGAAAACALVAVLFTTNQLQDEAATSIYADVNGSGAIDIADVLALARTGQGVHQDDLDAFAFRVVSLDREGAS